MPSPTVFIVSAQVSVAHSATLGISGAAQLDGVLQMLPFPPV
ncbi:MAG TPA: hypothetical protein VHZ74_11410 [Bryobacteraceae bacterium]|nr:hypothetical protein [Bryobacteraceae bacterium]